MVLEQGDKKYSHLHDDAMQDGFINVKSEMFDYFCQDRYACDPIDYSSMEMIFDE